MSAIVVEEVSLAHADRMGRFFDACGSTCFCRYWHFGGSKNDWLDRCANHPDVNECELRAAIRENDPSAQGLVAIDPSLEIVGWLKLAPRGILTKLTNLSVYRTLEAPVETMSIACILVRPEARKRGIARTLVNATSMAAAKRGASTIEAYPRRSSAPLHDEEAWQGPETIFIAEGFVAVHDVAPYPVYRKTLR